MEGLNELEWTELIRLIDLKGKDLKDITYEHEYRNNKAKRYCTEIRKAFVVLDVIVTCE